MIDTTNTLTESERRLLAIYTDILVDTGVIASPARAAIRTTLTLPAQDAAPPLSDSFPQGSYVNVPAYGNHPCRVVNGYGDTLMIEAPSGMIGPTPAKDATAAPSPNRSDAPGRGKR